MARRRHCYVCGAVLPKNATRRRLYCGPACRAQAYRDRQVTVRIGALGGLLMRARATDDGRLLWRLLCPVCGRMTYAAGPGAGTPSTALPVVETVLTGAGTGSTVT